MWSVTVVAASAYPVPILDVCPPVQEDFDGPEVAFLSSTVEGSPSILSETQGDKIHGIQILYMPHIHNNILTFIPTFIYISYMLYRV